MTFLRSSMTELKATLTTGGLFYLPKELRMGFGRHLRVLSDACSAVVFPEDADYEDVLGSLAVIKADLEHRIYLAKKHKRTQ